MFLEFQHIFFFRPQQSLLFCFVLQININCVKKKKYKGENMSKTFWWLFWKKRRKLTKQKWNTQNRAETEPCNLTDTVSSWKCVVYGISSQIAHLLGSVLKVAWTNLWNLPGKHFPLIHILQINKQTKREEQKNHT